jgi:hypothetical protein
LRKYNRIVSFSCVFTCAHCPCGPPLIASTPARGESESFRHRRQSAYSASILPVIRPALTSALRIERYSCSRPNVLSVITKSGFASMSARVMTDCGHYSAAFDLADGKVVVKRGLSTRVPRSLSISLQATVRKPRTCLTKRSRSNASSRASLSADCVMISV